MGDDIFGDMMDLGKKVELHLEGVRGIRHLYRRFPLDPEPGQPIQLILTTSGGKPYDKARCIFTTDGTVPSPEKGTTKELEPVSVKWDPILWDYVREWRVEIPSQPAKTLIQYHLEARREDDGKWVTADPQPGRDQAENFSLWVDDDPAPEWAREAIIYQVFPDRFNPGNGKSWNKPNSITGFYGGTLRGVTEKLDHIQSLGSNAIWLNPFFPSNSHHGYNASDMFTVEPRLGTMKDLRNLIKEAHKRDIHLILDFVANHWSKDHFTFKEAQKNPGSQYRDWYTWKHWPDDYESYFNVRELPKINLRSESARNYMLEAARYWLEEGFDGYRLDFAYGPPTDFWVKFRRACREVKPDCWIFGEVIHNIPMILSYTGILDGTLDFHLTRSLRETFAKHTQNLDQFESFLSKHEAYFPAEHIRPSFLDNHDETRFLYLAGNDKSKLKLAALLIYTLEGPPILYYGTETGLSQERPSLQNGRNIFEECRLPMNWETVDESLLEYFRRLGNLRRKHSVLWNGTRRVIHLDSRRGTYAYLREGKEEKVLIVMNASDSSQDVNLPVNEFQDSADLLNGNPLDYQNEILKINLLPQSGAFLLKVRNQA